MLATWITLSRVPVLILAISLLSRESAGLSRLGAVSLLIGLLLDSADGIVARRRGEVSLLGSVLDIAIDRTYEVILWFYFAHRGLIPLAIPIIVAIRTALTDGLRSVGTRDGAAPFDQLRSPLGRFLVASSWMRTAYGFSKVLAFGGLAAICAGASDAWIGWIQSIAWACVALCVLRGIPVVLETARRMRFARRLPLAAILVVTLNGCFLGLDDRCGDFSRSVTATAAPSDSAHPGGYLQLQLVEQRGDQPVQNLWWIAVSPALRGHILTASLRGAGQPAQLLVSLPVTSPDGGDTTMGELFPYSGLIGFRDLYRLVQRNGVTLALTTDLAGSAEISLLMRLSEDDDWAQPHCS